MGLPYGEEMMILGRTMWTQSTSVTDGRTDGQTDRITMTKTVQRIASHGKNKWQMAAASNMPQYSKTVWKKSVHSYRFVISNRIYKQCNSAMVSCLYSIGYVAAAVPCSNHGNEAQTLISQPDNDVGQPEQPACTARITPDGCPSWDSSWLSVRFFSRRWGSMVAWLITAL